MKDYSIGECKKNYILRIEEELNGESFTVVFANGSRFTDVEMNEENIKKIIAIQDRQAKEGVANKNVFVGKRTKAGILTGLNAVALLAASTAATSIPFVANALAGQSPVVVAAGIGTISILGSIPSIAKLVKECDKVSELEKLEYLQKNRAKLENFRSYHNVLRGLNRSAANHFANSENPYCILDIDEFEKKDLEQMMENIEKEEAFGFTYKKKNTGASK